MVNSGDSGRESVVRRGLDVGQGVERDEQSDQPQTPGLTAVLEVPLP